MDGLENQGSKLEPYSELKHVLPYHMLSFFNNPKELSKLLSSKNQFQMAGDRTIIEVGAYLGASSAFFASLVGSSGTVYAIDWWQGLNYAQIEIVPGTHQEGWGHKLPLGCSMYDQYLSNMIHLNIANVVYPVLALSKDGADILIAKGVNSADLVYLDADHSYTSVLEDCRTWFPFVSNGRGVLCGDDWGWCAPELGWNYILGVNRAVSQFADENNLTVHVEGVFWWLEEKQ